MACNSNVHRIGSAFLFREVKADPKADAIDKWSFPYFIKENFKEMINSFYTECGFEAHYKNHNIRNVRINVKILDLSPSAVKIPGQSGPRRIAIDTQEQWEWGRQKIVNGVGEVMVLICGMSSVENQKTKSTEVPELKKKRLSCYCSRRDKEYDRARQTQNHSDSNEVDTNLDKFKGRCQEKYPTCVVHSAAKIECGKCGKVITLSCPRSLRNFDRHMGTHNNVTTDSNQRSILSFASNRATSE